MKTLSLLTLTFILGCNSLGRHTEQPFDSKIETAKADMSAEVHKAKEDFLVQYRAAENRWPDSFNKRKLQVLKSSIISTGNYLDSLKGEMDKLDEMEVSNVELIKTTFLYGGAGDSIINKFRNSIAAAQN